MQEIVVNESGIVKLEDIQTKIFTLRGLQVMFDKDLALFYNVKPIRLREQVKRNLKRFPSDFMFQISDEEVEFMLSQNAIPSKSSLGGSLPFVFTEQGVSAVSAILTSERAIEVNILIMRAFVAMRRFIASNAHIFQRLDNIEYKQIETDRKIEDVLNALESKEIKPKQGIFFDGQFYDAYSFIIQLLQKAKKELIIIDNFIDNTILDMLTKKNKGVSVSIITQPNTKLLTTDIQKFNLQYPTLTLKHSNLFHDRFIIIDSKELYHIGASLKDLGKKCFAFSLIEDKSLISNLLNNL